MITTQEARVEGASFSVASEESEMSMPLLYTARTVTALILPSRRRFFSTVAASSSTNHRRRKQYTIYALTAAAAFSAMSIHTRRSRHENISSLTPARDSGLLSPHQVSSIIEEVKRAGLMGKAKSVKEELDCLRKYHIENGYLGGLIVRDLSQPLFSIDDEHKDARIQEVKFDSSSHDNKRTNNTENAATKEKNVQNVQNVLNETDTDMAQRECYYLYYEIKSNGHTKQEIFCRGTTLLVDVLTCLQSWFIYDEELGCHVHHGFKKHADRVVEDVLPLLAKPGDYSTIGVAGHSLGGAVAVLVAAKLRKRGYRVTNVLSVAGPRVCRRIEDGNVLERSLPKQTLRIENDVDIVPLLPPSGVSVGDKLWLVSDEGQQNAFILSKSWLRDPENSWSESIWLNMKVFETVINQHKAHRIATHVARLETDLFDINKD